MKKKKVSLSPSRRDSEGKGKEKKFAKPVKSPLNIRPRERKTFEINSKINSKKQIFSKFISTVKDDVRHPDLIDLEQKVVEGKTAELATTTQLREIQEKYEPLLKEQSSLIDMLKILNIWPLCGEKAQQGDENEDSFLPLSSYYDMSNEKSSTYTFPCEGRYLTESETEWVECTVLGCSDGHTSEYDIRVKHSGEEISNLPKVRVNLDCEDMITFACRFYTAVKRRHRSHALLRYNLYVDCMPSDQVGSISRKQLERIVKTVFNNKVLRKHRKTLDPKDLLSEVNLAYSRTMNKILFDMKLRSSTQSSILSDSLDLPVPEIIGNDNAKPVPEKGVFPIDEYNFPYVYSKTYSLAFCAETQMLSGMLGVHELCQAVMGEKYALFVMKRDCSLPIEKFGIIQRQNVDKVCGKFKDEWPHKIKTLVKQCMKSEEYNFQEKIRENYENSVLKRYFTCIKLRMQDILRDCIVENVTAYVKYIKDACVHDVSVKSSYEVEVEGATPNDIPIFWLELIETQKEQVIQKEEEEEEEGDEEAEPETELVTVLALNDEIEPYAEIPAIILDEIIKSLHGIVQVQKLAMDRLYWGDPPTLLTVEEEEDIIKNSREEIVSSIKSSFPLLEQYVVTFDKFLDFLRLDVEAFLKKLSGEKDKQEDDDKDDDDDDDDEDDKRPPLEIEKISLLIETHMNGVAEVETEIPNDISLGAFKIDCSKIRKKLSAKHQELVDKMLALVNNRVREDTTALLRRYSDMNKELSRFPQDIEELVEIQEYISKLPKLLEDMQEDIDILWKSFDLLDKFNFQIAVHDFNQQWKLFGGEKMILDKQEATSEMLEKEKVRYANIQKEKQEDFVVWLEKLDAEVKKFDRHNDLEKIESIVKSVKTISENIQKAKDDATLFNNRESLFEQELTDYEKVEEIAREFQPYETVWATIGSWIDNEDRWKNGPFTELVPTECEKIVTEAAKNMSRSVKFFEKAKLPLIKEAAEKIKARIEDFKPLLPMIECLRNPGMGDRHWEQLSQELGFELKADGNFNLQKAIDLNLHQHEELLMKVSGIAAKEFQIEQSLDKMDSEWAPVFLDCVAYKSTGTYVLRGIDELMAILDEHITMVQALQFSSFKGPFAERIDEFDRKLMMTSEVLEVWIAVQRNWLYLQPIFDSPDINKQLPAEGKRFSQVDKNWRQTLAAAQGALAIDFCPNEKLLEKFKESNILLDMVSKGLSDYLETKRGGFARFYFLSNDELLEILSETKDPKMVQPHLKKCFEGIKSVEFDDLQIITHMLSAEGEIVPLCNPVNPEGKNVEVWMTELEEDMRVSVKSEMWNSMKTYLEQKRTEWLQHVPGQCALNGSQFHWTREIEEAMDAHGNKGVGMCFEQQVQQINDMVALVRSPTLGSQARMTISALTVIDVHARDVVEKIFKAGVKTKDEFQWISQMRYYWEGEALEGDLWVMMVSSKRPYGYEYLGNSFRLVITPLTDKCYMTLMGALQMILGGAPAGPAGTGKTETTKDLAKALAKQCVVFNCSDGLDYIAMGKFFKGLASCGAWACFDEFNRIDVEVLSVVAQQIMTLQGGVIAGKTRIVFEGVEIALSDQFAVYITMNPGYAGRTELPDNLKARFRPVAMMVPDYGLIGEIMLYSFGYEKARLCAQKMVATFRLCSEQLSAQSHYDYGMRAVKTTIVAAGNLRRDYPDEEEEILLLRALQDVNTPKFLNHDLPLFRGIISDLFPGMKRPDIDYGPLVECLRLSNEKMGLQNTPWFVSKQIELYETIVVRHGLMLVGPTGGGKTRNCMGLDHALGMLKDRGVEGFAYEQVQRHILNPKSITMGQLYGEFDPNTHEWQDGILANMVRVCAKSTTPDRKWIVFDGPVDAIWIENMNTVLDDNKKLCLNSGEIMSLSAEMTMMFEVEDLDVASPATVSRVGIIFMEPNTLGNDTIVQSWLQYRIPSFFEKEQRQLLLKLFDSFVASCFFLLRKLVEPAPTVNNNLLASLLRMMDALFNQIFDKEEDGTLKNIEAFDMEKDLEALFFFSFVWSMLCTVDAAGRKIFDAWLRTKMDQNMVDCQFPKQGMVYDYKWDIASHSWVKWMNTIEPYKYNKSLSFAETIVPTADSVCYTYLFDTLVRKGSNVLMTGPTGTGKTVNINRHLSIGLPGEYVPLCLTFSAQTSANQTQDILDGKMEKRRKGVFGPPAGKTFIIFVDDLNMPQREEYFAQPPIELLRQWFDYGGWYDRKTLLFRSIIDCIMVAAMGPPGGGRNPVTMRMIRHYNVIGYTMTEAESMKTIFGTILNNFLRDGFNTSLPALADPIVESTINVYFTILKELLPTPEKTHYTFNMRDMGKVFQGMLMCSSKTITEQPHLITLWVHECRRVFKDRLVNDEDRKWFDDLISKQVKETIGNDWEKINDGAEYLIFGDLLDPDSKQYIHIEDEKQLLESMVQYLGEYNAESKTPMNLKLFMDAVQHIARISRIIAQPMGNALLLGVGGSGRKSLSKLATYVADFTLCQVEIAKGYGLTEWREDIKGFLLTAGVEDKNVTFLFDDTQIIMSQMLEDINGILNAGDVPNIYALEDIDRIMTACRGDCVKKKIQPTKLNIFSQYILRVKRNIHAVICMSPGTAIFRDRLRMFPALVNCCTIDWFSEWPDEALQSVGFGIMQEEDLKIDDHLDNVVDLFKVFHQSVAVASREYYDATRRNTYVTPTSYLELLNTFKSLLIKKRVEVGEKKQRLQIGLDKMFTTAEQVAELQEQLIEMQPVLQKTQVEVDAMIVQITKDKAAAAETKAVVTKEEEAAQVKATATKAIADDAQRDLDEALPALDEAVKCLNKLKKADIDEVKSLKTPPKGVVLTVEASCIMFSIKPAMVKDPDNMGKKKKDYWDVGKTNLLADSNKLLQNLFNYDKDNIPDKVIEQIQPYIEMDAFQPKEVEKASKACTAICMWVRAMNTYHWVAKGVEPKRKALAEAQAELDVTMAKLQKARDTLQGVMDKIQELEEGLNASLQKKDDLANEVEQCSARLDRAHKLIGGLGGEKDRWTAAVAQFDIDYVNLLGDVLISSGSIAYLGPFSSDFRQQLVSKWRSRLEALKIPHTSGCNLVNTLGNPVTIRSWQVAGLPGDQLSTENAIVMQEARRWPLLIDPQTQANKFIKTLGKQLAEQGIEVTKPSNKNFLRTLENGVRFGKWILLENISEKLDAALEPVLLQQVFKVQGQNMIKLGDNTVPYNDTFRFFMTTKLPNPHYPPEVSVKVSLLNFSITPGGLEEQLLGIIMANELPDLEEKKNELVVNNAEMASKLQEIEDLILYMLANSKGNILDDAELIETLANSKVTSEEINEKVAEAKVTEVEIDTTRELYRPFAYRGSILFFVIAELRVIDPMYEYSLQWFNQLFAQGILNSEPNNDVDARLEIMKDFFTYLLYDNVCRSLYEIHKLLFSFNMCIKILQGDDKIDGTEWRFLLSGQGGKASDHAKPDGEDAAWVTEKTWQEVCNLSSLDSFRGFEIDFKERVSEWRQIFDSETCYEDPLPGKWEHYDSLKKMLILRCVRPDKMTEAIQNYLVEYMGQRFIEPPPFDMKKCYDSSIVTTPLIFLLTAGSDPTKDFYLFAETQGMAETVKAISLGQGQGPIAARMVAEGMEKGDWVLLQNCHLCSSWMDDLEVIVEEINPETCNESFRLWLTSMPTKTFPVSILQNGVKMTKEPPKGLRANLKSAYYRLDDSQLQVTSKPVTFMKLLYGLCFFHALIQERRKFGSLGWNIPYEFNETDLDISLKQLSLYLDLYDEVPYEVLNFLTSYINYGGRVTDAIDLRTIDRIMKQYYNPEILRDDYKFSESGIYYSFPVNEDSPQRGYIEQIEKLPVNADPEVFAMHNNANITCALNETYFTFDTLVLLQPRSSSGGGKTREEIIGEDAKDIESRLPQDFDIEAITMSYPVRYEESMNTVLCQECIRYDKLLLEIKQTLYDLQKALKGLVVMSGQLEDMGTSMYAQKVPVMWEKKAYPSMKPLKAWVQEFLDRLKFMNTWIDEGMPPAYWVSGFYFPQAFLTGQLQNYARKNVFPIDQVGFNYKVHLDPVDAIISKPEDGCYVYGLFLEGARFCMEAYSIVESRPKELYTQVPVIHFNPERNRKAPTKGVYRTPIYKVLSRQGTLSTTGHSTNFVMWIELPSNRKTIINNIGMADQDEWIKAGVAAFCSLKF